MFIIAQLVGLIAMTGTISAFQINNRKGMLKVLIGTAFLYSVHFFLLGAYTGTAMNAVNMFRNYVFYNKYDKKWANSNLWLVFFIVLFIFMGLLTWQGWYSSLPVIAVVSGAVAFWMKNPRYIRLLALIASPCWFVYNFIVGSYPGMAVEIFTATSIVVAIIRYDILKR